MEQAPASPRLTGTLVQKVLKGMNQKMKRKLAASLAALLVCLVAALVVNQSTVHVAAKGANWAQWRGPEGQGVSRETGVPTEWSATKNVLWKTPIPGLGHSSPIIWEKKVFVTTAIEGAVVPGAHAVKHVIENEVFLHPDSVGADRLHTFKVLCLDRDTGKVLWERTAFTGTPYDNRHRRSSFASPTPTTDGKLVYAYFGTEGLYAYDFTGRLAWKKDLGKLGTLGMGIGTSPVLYENLLIVLADTEAGENSFIVALDKKTGKEVWRAARKVQASWATPIIVRTAKRTELITVGNESVISYDPATGKELWHAKGVDSNAIPSPLSDGEMVYVYAGFPKKITMAMRLGGDGELKDKTDIVWSYDKGTAYVPSGILYQGYLYLMNDKGILTCLDAKTGAIKYEGGRVPVPSTFMASPIAFGDKILLTSEDGDTFVVKAGPKHEVLGTNSLGEPVHSSPAIADDKLFIRGDQNLYCIGNARS
jgi:outer membrane protein assembly factor BamB